MKTLARTGAILSFAFLFVPGLFLVVNTGSGREGGVIVFGLILMGLGCFAGTLLWLTGEKVAQSRVERDRIA